jgi:branched-chain amino acid transport system ATP-binding protein
MSQSTPPVLETRELTIRFGGHVAVNAVSCAFHRGTLTAIVGPNGAGKTTYFNLLSGQLRPSGGTVHLLGTDVTGHGVPRRTRQGMGRGFQLTNLYPSLSVLENVRLAIQSVNGSHYNFLRIAGRDARLTDEARGVLERVKLRRHADQPAATLGHGDQRKLEVAILLALQPKVFLFDEPTAGMSVDEIPMVLELIEGLKADGDKTILLVEHKMDVVQRLADRIIVLQDGTLIADGEPAQVVASAAVQNAYLGLAPAAAAEIAGASGHGG